MDQRNAGHSSGTANPYDDIDRLYDAWTALVNYDIDFYRRVAGSERNRLGVDQITIIEIGAGSGRITLPLLEEGHKVIALDISSKQLKILEEKAAASRFAENLTVIEGDMRKLDEYVNPESAHLILAPFRAMMHTAPDRDTMLPKFVQALVPDGAFSFDVNHPHMRDVLAPPYWLLRIMSVDEQANGTWFLWESAEYDISGTFLREDLRFEFLPGTELDSHDAPLTDEQIAEIDGARVVKTVLEMHAPIAHEWRQSLEAAGLQPETVFGWFDERPYELDSSESIWVTRKA